MPTITDRLALVPAPEADRLQRVIDEVIEPGAADVDRKGLFPAAAIQALADADLGLLTLPADLGGQGARTRVYADAMARLSAACGSTATVYMTQLHCAHPIHLLGSDEQRTYWIPRIARGEAIGAIALTEPEAGSDVAAMRTSARRDADEYVLNGTKIFISNGDVADVIVLFATVDPSRGRDGITAFLIDTRDLPGFDVSAPMVKLGQKGASTVELTFQDCRIPASARLGEEGEGYPLLLQSVQKSRISAAAQGVGFATGALAATAEHLAERGMLSSARRDAQDIQFALAELSAQTAAAHTMLIAASDLVDDEDADPTVEVSMLKLHCTALGVKVAAACVQLLGDAGDRPDLGVERRLRDAKIAEIYDGTNQVQSMLVARGIRVANTR